MGLMTEMLEEEALSFCSLPPASKDNSNFICIQYVFVELNS